MPSMKTSDLLHLYSAHSRSVEFGLVKPITSLLSFFVKQTFKFTQSFISAPYSPSPVFFFVFFFFILHSLSTIPPISRKVFYNFSLTERKKQTIPNADNHPSLVFVAELRYRVFFSFSCFDNDRFIALIL